MISSGRTWRFGFIRTMADRGMLILGVGRGCTLRMNAGIWLGLICDELGSWNAIEMKLGRWVYAVRRNIEMLGDSLGETLEREIWEVNSSGRKANANYRDHGRGNELVVAGR